MKNFSCRCGQRIFFENFHCTHCNQALGFAPDERTMHSLLPEDSGLWRSEDGRRFKLCRNTTDYAVCNWLIDADSPDELCLACGLNQMIPALTAPEQRQWWADMEAAKRRLIYTLLQLQLPVINKATAGDRGLAFAFLEDQRDNPQVQEPLVHTGHRQGLITVNLAEADDARRERARVELGEPYRTLLGHFRHESGHYYFDLFRDRADWLNEFRQLFGDEREDYQQALQEHYNGAGGDWQVSFISRYAQVHPLEDWAECWAHYMHILDTLETAADFGLVDHTHLQQDIGEWLSDWVNLTVMLNALNRSMGLRDAYPFVLSEPVITKLRFVHRTADPRKTPRPTVATA